MVTNSIHLKARRKNSDIFFEVAVFVFLSLILAIILFPLIYIVSASLSDPINVITGKVFLWPRGLTFDGYISVFRNKAVMSGYRNSIINTCLGTSINLSLTMLAAFPLSRKEFIYNNIIMKLFVFTMLFSGGLIPLYMLVKNLDLLDNRFALLLPSAMSVYNMIVARTFIRTSIPEELFEATSIDGGNEFDQFFHVVLPLSKPVLGVLGLMYAIVHWNSYFSAMIFISNPDLQPLQIALRSILLLNSIDLSTIADPNTAREIEGMRDLLKYSLIVVASLPVMAIYPFVQRYFVKGMMLGSIKG